MDQEQRYAIIRRVSTSVFAALGDETRSLLIAQLCWGSDAKLPRPESSKMRLFYTERFRRDYAHAPDEVQRQCDKLALLTQDFRHPSVAISCNAISRS